MSETDDGVVALVIDLADRGALANEDVEDDALFCIFSLNAQVFKVAGVPERIEVALDRNRVVGVAGMGEEARKDRFLGNAAIADDPDLVNGLRGLGQGGARGNDQQEQQRDSRHPAKDLQCATERSVLYLHRAGVLRRAQILVRSMVKLHGKNMHTLIA